MKSHPRHGKAAFTLIELMAVITIIVILAGLVVMGMGFVNERQAREKAKTQIALLSKGIEEFKLDYGFYPPGKKATVDGVSTVVQDTTKQTSNGLYISLYWDTDYDGKGAIKNTGDRDDEDQKVYVQQLDPNMKNGAAKNAMGWIDTFGSGAIIKDPWGNAYNYRLGGTDPVTGKPLNTNAQNPDFDLWSFGKDGVSNTTNPSLSDRKNKDDIRNF